MRRAAAAPTRPLRTLRSVSISAYLALGWESPAKVHSTFVLDESPFPYPWLTDRLTPDERRALFADRIVLAGGLDRRAKVAACRAYVSRNGGSDLLEALRVAETRGRLDVPMRTLLRNLVHEGAAA